MPGLLLTGVALCTALIMAAALVVIGQWRRSKGQPPAPASARGAAAGPAGNAMARDRHRARFRRHRAARPRRPGAGAAGAGGAPAGQADARPTARPARSRATAQWPAGHRQALTTSEQIASYYDQADQPMADYLTALGWTQPPHNPQPPGPAERTRRHPPPSDGHRQ